MVISKEQRQRVIGIGDMKTGFCGAGVLLLDLKDGYEYLTDGDSMNNIYYYCALLYMLYFTKIRFKNGKYSKDLMWTYSLPSLIQ